MPLHAISSHVLHPPKYKKVMFHYNIIRDQILLKNSENRKEFRCKHQNLTIAKSCNKTQARGFFVCFHLFLANPPPYPFIRLQISKINFQYTFADCAIKHGFRPKRKCVFTVPESTFFGNITRVCQLTC